jgi:hypothetical protein
MVTENEAMVVIEEGTDIEMQVESFLCCQASFMYFY